MNFPMSLCARAVALWLAACALAARAHATHALHEERVRPDCTSHSYHSCRRLNMRYCNDNRDYYLLNDKEVEIYSDWSKEYRISCTNISFVDPAWPSFPSLKVFDHVTLVDCELPDERKMLSVLPTSYAAELQKRNVSILNHLSITIPATAHISASSFAGLSNLQELTVTATNGLMIFKAGTLGPLCGLRRLHLERVRAEQLPDNLDVLQLINTGVNVLPPEALKVKSLDISEDRLLSINMSALQLKSLHAPALESLVLYDASPVLLQDGFLEECCSAIKVVELRRATSDEIPPSLLRGARNLTSFIYTHSNISTLSKYLFIDTEQLEYIDVSDNKLDSLPMLVFSGLIKLRVLRLEGNLLSALDVRAVVPLTALVGLNLSFNPLGDLCINEDVSPLSPLQNLQELSLVLTGVSRVCVDWLRKPSLKHLDLQFNLVRSVLCSEIGQIQHSGLTVDLSENPLEFYCCQNEVRTGVVQDFKVKLLTNFKTKGICNCSYVQCVEKDVPIKFDDVKSYLAKQNDSNLDDNGLRMLSNWETFHAIMDQGNDGKLDTYDDRYNDVRYRLAKYDEARLRHNRSDDGRHRHARYDDTKFDDRYDYGRSTEERLHYAKSDDGSLRHAKYYDTRYYDNRYDYASSDEGRLQHAKCDDARYDANFNYATIDDARHHDDDGEVKFYRYKRGNRRNNDAISETRQLDVGYIEYGHYNDAGHHNGRRNGGRHDDVETSTVKESSTESFDFGPYYTGEEEARLDMEPHNAGHTRSTTLMQQMK